MRATLIPVAILGVGWYLGATNAPWWAWALVLAWMIFNRGDSYEYAQEQMRNEREANAA